MEQTGIVVSKVGTYPIHRQELIDLWMSLQEGKICRKVSLFLERDEEHSSAMARSRRYSCFY